MNPCRQNDASKQERHEWNWLLQSHDVLHLFTGGAQEKSVQSVCNSTAWRCVAHTVQLRQGLLFDCFSLSSLTVNRVTSCVLNCGLGHRHNLKISLWPPANSCDHVFTDMCHLKVTKRMVRLISRWISTEMNHEPINSWVGKAMCGCPQAMRRVDPTSSEHQR